MPTKDKNDYRDVQKFIGMVGFGSIVAVLIGTLLDSQLNTTPWLMVFLLLYVVVGSLFWLVKTLGAKKDGR